MAEKDIQSELIAILRRMDPLKRSVTARTRILTELDFDSLRMLDLIEELKVRFGIDLLAAPYSLQDLRTPETLAAALSGKPGSAGAQPPG